MILIIGGKSQGKKEFAKKNFPDMELIADLHRSIYEKIEAGEDISAFAEELISGHTNAVITCDEVGNGVVPVMAKDRDYREMVGYVLIELAKEAEGVYRVFCGIGVRIK